MNELVEFSIMLGGAMLAVSIAVGWLMKKNIFSVLSYLCLGVGIVMFVAGLIIKGMASLFLWMFAAGSLTCALILRFGIFLCNRR